jgi:hypothetical protein
VKIQHLTTGVCWAVLLHSSVQQILIAAISLADDQQFQGCFTNTAVIVILNCRAHSVPENWQGHTMQTIKTRKYAGHGVFSLHNLPSTINYRL